MNLESLVQVFTLYSFLYYSDNYISEDDDNTDESDKEDKFAIEEDDFETFDIIQKVDEDEDDVEYMLEERLQEDVEVSEEVPEVPELDIKVEIESSTPKVNKLTVKSSAVLMRKSKEKCRVCLDEYSADKMQNIYEIDSTEVLNNSFFDMSERLKINEKVEYCCGVRVSSL